MTCWTRSMSMSVTKLSAAFSTMNFTAGSCTRWLSDWQTTLNSLAKSVRCGTMARGLMSSADVSKMSLMSRMSMSQLLWMMLMNSFLSAGSLTVCRRSENPTMAFSGVRISWVMFARKVAFSLVEFFALAVSSRSLSCAFMRSVTFRTTPKSAFSLPSAPVSGMPLMANQAGWSVTAVRLNRRVMLNGFSDCRTACMLCSASPRIFASMPLM